MRVDTIKSYIENIFRGYPDTEEVLKAKKELLSIMEDKYQELKEQGKTENEAIGIVISEFGNMDELAEELGLSKETKKEDDIFAKEENSVTIKRSEAEEYINTQRSVGRRVSVGVALCITSVLPAAIIDSLKAGGYVNKMTTDIVSAVTFFGMIAIAVIIFISTSALTNIYKEWEKKVIILDADTTKYIEGEHRSYNGVFTKMIATGVALCIISIVPGAVSDAVFKDGSFDWLGNMIASSLFAFVAVGVVIFINAGMKKNAFEKLLNKGDYSPEKIKADNEIIGVIAAVYWPFVTAVYLGWSFISFKWQITWIIWPVAGVIFGGISAVCSIISKKSKTN